MYLSKIEIENYRTFAGIEMVFQDQMNYLVGDNNIGKSNFLDLLETSLSGRGFGEADFLDPEKPVRVRFTLRDGRGGEAVMELTQYVHEAAPVLRNGTTGETLPLEYIRRMYYLPHTLHDAARMAASGEDFQDIGEIFRCCLDGPDGAEELQALLAEHGIDVDLTGAADAAALQMMRAIYGPHEALGGARNTVQVIFAVGLHILAALLRKKRSRAVPFEEIVTVGQDGKRCLPVLVSIDEPEHHLHPYMQRAVLSYVHRIMNNKEPFFLHMVRRVLGIDGLDGQVFVVTHSTDALINDYRSIIRLYWDADRKVQAACGAAFHFDREIEKHLIMHFPEVKEALYARCALLVEGETEYGSFDYFSRTLGMGFDNYGICLINARGESSIGKIAQLLRRFHVPSLCFYDRDVKEGKRLSPYVFYTDYLCYEMDVVQACLHTGARASLDEVIRDVSDGETRVSAALVKKACQKLGLSKVGHPPRKLENISGRDRKALEFYYFAWLYGNKGVIIGRALGLALTAEEIPPSFRKVIRAVAETAEGRA